MSESAGEKDAEQPVTDRQLRHVEKDVLITQMVRKKAHELCYEPYVKAFEECIRGRTVSMVWKCREENSRMRECLAHYYTSSEFFDQCTEEYLKQREEFRRTGVTQKEKKKTHYYGV